jgi:hypothetical protein
MFPKGGITLYLFIKWSKHLWNVCSVPRPRNSSQHLSCLFFVFKAYFDVSHVDIRHTHTHTHTHTHIERGGGEGERERETETIGTCRGQKTYAAPEVGTTGSCEPDMGGARNQSHIHWKSSKSPYSVSHLSKPIYPFFRHCTNTSHK